MRPRNTPAQKEANSTRMKRKRGGLSPEDAEAERIKRNRKDWERAARRAAERAARAAVAASAPFSGAAAAHNAVAHAAGVSISGSAVDGESDGGLVPHNAAALAAAAAAAPAAAEPSIEARVWLQRTRHKDRRLALKRRMAGTLDVRSEATMQDSFDVKVLDEQEKDALVEEAHVALKAMERLVVCLVTDKQRWTHECVEVCVDSLTWVSIKTALKPPADWSDALKRCYDASDFDPRFEGRQHPPVSDRPRLRAHLPRRPRPDARARHHRRTPSSGHDQG